MQTNTQVTLCIRSQMAISDEIKGIFQIIAHPGSPLSDFLHDIFGRAAADMINDLGGMAGEW